MNNGSFNSMNRYLSHLCSLMAFVASIAPSPGFSQGDGYDYFPSVLMRSDDVRSVVCYEVVMDDPLGQAGLGNQIRLAKDVAEEIFFDNHGNCVRKIYFGKGGVIRDYVLFTYDDKHHCTQRDYHHRAGSSPNDPDTNSVVLLQTKTVFKYRGEKCVARIEYNGSASRNDSTVYEYDSQGRPTRSLRYASAGNLERRLEYKANEVIITSWANNAIVSKELQQLDAQGRIVKREYFQGETLVPTSRELLTYHPRGWLQGLDYEYPGLSTYQVNAIITQQNFYDDHGKLLESYLDYGTGTRLVRMYDYSYHFEND